MLRRQTRLRREYLFHKHISGKRKAAEVRRDHLRNLLHTGAALPVGAKKELDDIQKQLAWEDEGGEGVITHEDDEYRWAGVADPKIVITTSRDPSSRLKQFAKEIKLVFPNSQRINRGNYEMVQLMEACRANAATDFIVLSETRGKPDGMIISHLPYGPTAYFNISNCVMRHDVPDVGTMSQAYPNLIFHNFRLPTGIRCMNIIKHLFPVPKPDSQRIISLINNEDFVSFRHHFYKKVEGGKQVELTEVGPRFELKLYEIKLGTLEQAASVQTEWALRPFMRTARKRMFFSDQPGFPDSTDADAVEFAADADKLAKKQADVASASASSDRDDRKRPAAFQDSSRRQRSLPHRGERQRNDDAPTDNNKFGKPPQQLIDRTGPQDAKQPTFEKGGKSFGSRTKRFKR